MHLSCSKYYISDYYVVSVFAISGKCYFTCIYFVVHQ